MLCLSHFDHWRGLGRYLLLSIFVIGIHLCPKIVCCEIIKDRIIGLVRCVVLTQENFLWQAKHAA